MTFFVEPAIEIEKFEMVDVITTSVPGETQGDYLLPETELDSLELPEI